MYQLSIKMLFKTNYNVVMGTRVVIFFQGLGVKFNDSHQQVYIPKFTKYYILIFLYVFK